MPGRRHVRGHTGQEREEMNRHYETWEMETEKWRGPIERNTGDAAGDALLEALHVRGNTCDMLGVLCGL